VPNPVRPASSLNPARTQFEVTKKSPLTSITNDVMPVTVVAGGISLAAPAQAKEYKAGITA
jgi:hypothetical protein